MKAFIVENNIVVNSIEVEQGADLSVFNAVDLGQWASVGDTVSGNTTIESADRELQYTIDIKRFERNALLQATDWWATTDRTMTQEQIDYRQALRDFPAQEGFPNIDFPTKP